MRILLSAFSCAPHQGSEPGVGWRWALELARRHEVVVVTDATRAPLIEPELARAPVANLKVVYFRPGWLARVPLNSRTAQTLYTLWQFSLLPLARRLHAEHRFELAIHVTYGVWRHPSFLGRLGIPFVFGPLGGGEDVPLSLKKSIHGAQRLREIGRSAINLVARFDPFLWHALARSTHILVKTGETRDALPAPFRARARVWPEIGVDASPGLVPNRREPGAPLVALYAGRFLGLKGIHLAIRAVAAARVRGVPVLLQLVGQGPYGPTLQALAASLNLGPEALQWLGQVPQQRLFELYRGAHCLLFPSLHDSSGNVVLEAQAQGCPVVCLDCGGPAVLLGPGAGIAVPIAPATEEAVVERLADALAHLHADEAARQAMGEAAHRHALGWSWNRRVEGCLEALGYAQPARAAAPAPALELTPEAATR